MIRKTPVHPFAGKAPQNKNAKQQKTDKAEQNPDHITDDKECAVIVKPSFEHGYITMDQDGLAIAMIPRQI